MKFFRGDFVVKNGGGRVLIVNLVGAEEMLIDSCLLDCPEAIASQCRLVEQKDYYLLKRGDWYYLYHAWIAVAVGAVALCAWSLLF